MNKRDALMNEADRLADRGDFIRAARLYREADQLWLNSGTSH
ncbi:hypothetical protein [Jiangella anatolica]|nr:hypothetical protein [Jiangella anatolica]